jgi:8-oxo-dGTP pyrophosphatase MutT (NUDIX family)
MTTSDLPNQAAAIVFRRKDQNIEACLIRKKDSESWGIPKGLIDPGDTQEETALNEAWEEAGLRGVVEAESDAEFANTKDHARRVGFRTLLVAPLLREGTGIGAIAIRRVDPRHFGEKQIGLLQI